MSVTFILFLFFTNKECLSLRNECLYLLAYLIELGKTLRFQNSFMLSKLDMKYKMNVFYIEILVLLLVTKYACSLCISIPLLIPVKAFQMSSVLYLP